MTTIEYWQKIFCNDTFFLINDKWTQEVPYHYEKTRRADGGQMPCDRNCSVTNIDVDHE
jgi:hypothetical protein